MLKVEHVYEKLAFCDFEIGDMHLCKCYQMTEHQMGLFKKSL